MGCDGDVGVRSAVVTDVLVLLRECIDREAAKAPPLRDDRTVAALVRAEAAIESLRARVARLEGLA